MPNAAKKTKKIVLPSSLTKFQHVLMTFLLVLAPAGVCYGGFRCFDDFNDDTLGPIGGQNGWVSIGGDNRIAEDPSNPENYVLYIPSESSILRKSLSFEHVGVPEGTVRMMFMRLRVSRKQTFSLGLSPLSSPTEFSDFAPEIGMANSAQNLDLRVWDNDGGNYEILTQLAPDRWYNLWVLVDAQVNHYQIWLNDVEGSDADPADKLTAGDGDDTFEFRSGQNSSLLAFYVKTAGGGSSTNFGPIYIDDIYLELSNAVNLSNPLFSVPPLPGDANLDGSVDLMDFALMASHWGNGPIPPAVWGEGNFDYDDAVGLSDLHLMADYWLVGCGVE